MRNLFRSFERSGLDYLLISGQASILYGAATFSEDVDIWTRPTAANARRLLEALAARRARVYKLTPPISQRNLKKGHGFHFVIPSGPYPVYLDVMGQPPRVGPFNDSRRRARLIETDWGELPVVSIVDLIALKKTRRLSDYEVISNLVRIRLGETEPASRAMLRWAVKTTFNAEDRSHFFGELGRSIPVNKCRLDIAREIARHQSRDTRYWRPRIEELRRLRRTNKLLVEGTPVSRLVKSRRARQ